MIWFYFLLALSWKSFRMVVIKVDYEDNSWQVGWLLCWWLNVSWFISNIVSYLKTNYLFIRIIITTNNEDDIRLQPCTLQTSSFLSIQFEVYRRLGWKVLHMNERKVSHIFGLFLFFVVISMWFGWLILKLLIHSNVVHRFSFIFMTD